MPSKENKINAASGSHTYVCADKTKPIKVKSSKHHKSKKTKRRTKSPFCAGFHYRKQPLMTKSSSSSSEDSSEEDSSSDEEDVPRTYIPTVDPMMYQYYGMPMATPEMYGYMHPPVAYNPFMYPQPLNPQYLPQIPDTNASCSCGLAPIKEPSMMQAYSAHQYPPNKSLDPRFGPFRPIQ